MSLFIVPVIFFEQFLLFSQYCIFSFSQVTSFYCQFRLYQHHTIALLSNFIITQDLIVNYNFHHVATQDPVFLYTMYFIMWQLKILFSIIQCISSCSNSRSWSWHKICDTSFFLFNSKSSMRGQVLCVSIYLLICSG